MKITITAALLLASLALAAAAKCAEAAKLVPARTQIKLQDGIDDSKLTGGTVRIIQG